MKLVQVVTEAANSAAYCKHEDGRHWQIEKVFNRIFALQLMKTRAIFSPLISAQQALSYRPRDDNLPVLIDLHSTGLKNIQWNNGNAGRFEPSWIVVPYGTAAIGAIRARSALVSLSLYAIHAFGRRRASQTV
jgi:hypothetical protein